MNIKVVIGLVLIVLGVLALAFQGVSWTERETVIDVGPIQATAEEKKTFPIPPIAGIATLAAGVILVIAGARAPH